MGRLVCKQGDAQADLGELLVNGENRRRRLNGRRDGREGLPVERQAVRCIPPGPRSSPAR